MPDEFVIHWEVDNVSRLTAEGCRSPIYHHANLPWSLFVDKETSERTEFVPHLGLYLGCNNDDENDCNLWSCERKSTLSLLHRTAPEKSIHATHDVAFRKGVTDWGRNRFIAFESLLNPAEGFIEDDKIIVEARITVIATHHVRQMTIIDFSQPSPDADNVPVKFDDDGILYVCLRMLMWHSTFFASLIMNIEKDKLIKEITVKGVRTRDFTELLHVIFPSERPINVDSYWPVLRLAHLFGIERALDQVEMFLVKTKRVQTATKLLLAEQFKLERLMKYCLKSFETLTEMKDLENTTEFSKMSIALKASLLAKAFELI